MPGSVPGSPPWARKLGAATRRKRPSPHDDPLSVLLLTQPQDPALFAAALSPLLPGTTIWSHRAAADPARVEAVLAWRLEPGMVAPYRNLRLVCATAAGVEKITDAPDLRADVQVMRVVDPLVNVGLAQYVLLMALRHLRTLPLFEAQQRAHDWTRHRPLDPYSRTACVLGLGEAGRTIAAALQVAGFNVCGWSRSPKVLPGIAMFDGREGLDACLARANYLVCALPLTPATRGILNRTTLSRLPRGAYVINVARGSHIVEADLLALLDAGHLAGAALDVQETEPLPVDNPLWSHPLVTITPHIAAQASVETVAMQFAENWRRMRRGEPLANLVDRERGY
jgi:glyoxylate/hydroxypyruvate reductase A